jgi:hypothetical protein
MVETGDRLGFALESLAQAARVGKILRQESGRNLECDGSRQRDIEGAINLSRATGAYELDNLERTEPDVRRQRHGISVSCARM